MGIDIKLASQVTANIAALIKSLDSSKSQDRFDAALELSELEDPTVDEALIERLSGNDVGARCVAWVLATRQAENATPELVSSLTKEDEFLPIYATFALGKLGKVEAVEPLTEWIKSGDEDVRSLALDLISNINHPEKFDALLECLHSAKDPVVRLQVLKILGKIKEPALVLALMLGLMDPNFAVSKAAWDILYDTPDELLKEGLRRCLRKGNDTNFRIFIIRSLGEACDPRVVPFLVKCSLDKEDPVSSDAQEVLDEMYDQLRLRGLVACLGEDDEGVRNVARDTLKSIVDQQTVNYLTKKLSSQDEKEVVCKFIPAALDLINNKVVTN